MATVSTQSMAATGTAPTYSSASAGGDKVSPGAGVFMHVRNDSASAVTPTIVTPGTVGGLAIADQVCAAIAAGAEAFIPLTDINLYRNRDDGLADITWSATASVTFAVLVA